MSKPVFRAYGVQCLVNINETHLSKGGIHLPEDTQIERITRGVIVSCGPGCMTPAGQWDSPMVEVGDEILFDRSRAMRIPEAGPDIYVVHMTTIIAVLGEEELRPKRFVEANGYGIALTN